MATSNQQIDTVVMSGGAPMSPLMAGFLFALWKRGKTFRNFHTSGAGALMALLSIAPRKRTPGEALEGWAENGVADDIYQSFPINFKLFRKPGPFTPAVRRIADRYKLPLAGKSPIDDKDKVPSGEQPADADAKKDKRDPIQELLAEWIARPPHDVPDSDEVRRRIASPSAQLHASLLNLWRTDAGKLLYETLLSRKDPARMFRDKWLDSLFRTDKQRRAYNDLVDLWFAALTPSTLTHKSDGLAAPLPFLEELVDFDLFEQKINAIPGGHFCVNAYNMSADLDASRERFFERRKERRGTREAIKDLRERISKHGAGIERQRTRGAREKARRAQQAMQRELGKKLKYHRPDLNEILERKKKHRDAVYKVMAFFESPKPKDNDNPYQKKDEQLGPQHIRAAFSMPFIYPPAELDGNYYSEGADHQPINFHHLEDVEKNCTVVLLDVLADLEDYLVRRPRDLWDAYVISIMTPVVALARTAIDEFEEDQDHRASQRKAVVTLDKIHWELNSEIQPFVMDWSYSNLKTLFKVGEEAGEDFYLRVTSGGSTSGRLVDHPDPPE